MAFSYQEQTGDGVTTVFPFNFTGPGNGYIRESDVHVFIKDELGELVETMDFTFTGPNQLQMNVPPPASADEFPNIMIRRIMPKDAPYADFSRGNNFGQDQMNYAMLQQLYAHHEFLDGFLPEGYFVKGDMDFKGNRIINLGEPELPGDAVPLSFISSMPGDIEALKAGLREAPYVFASNHTTLDAANSIAVSRNVGLVIDAHREVTIAATISVPCVVVQGGQLDVVGALNITNTFEGCPGCLTGSGSLKMQGAIHPYFFTGTDAERVQRSLDVAMNHTYASYEEFNAVAFDREYNITGSTVLFKKANASNTADRRMLLLLGQGGGLKKTDAGFFFDYLDPVQPPTATADITGDITAKGMSFVGTSASGSTVWNSDKLIRVHSLENTYRGIDTVAAARGPRPALGGYPGLAQSLTFHRDTITGGRGWVWEFVDCADCTIDKCMVEYRAAGPDVGGLRNYQVDSVTPNVLNSALRVTNNVLEGIPGTAIRLGACTGTLISGNYFEYNYADIDLKTDSYIPHFGITLQGNFFNAFSPSAPDLTLAHVQWGILGPGATSIGNFFAGQPSHHISAVQTGTTGVLFSSGDYGTVHADTVGSVYLVTPKDLATLKTSLTALQATVAALPTISSGTWTPTLVGSVTPGVHTYAIRTGTWRKIGDQYFITCTLALSAKDAAMAGDVSITGLPASSGATFFPATIGKLRYTNLTAGRDGKLANILGTEIKLTELDYGTAETAELPGNITNNSYYSISATYIAVP